MNWSLVTYPLMYLLERPLCEYHAVGTQCFQGFLTWGWYHSPMLLNMEAHILIHRFIERTGIESRLRVPIEHERGRCNLGEFESQYPFVDFLMKGFDH